jgi:hypothetical protein
MHPLDPFLAPFLDALRPLLREHRARAAYLVELARTASGG